MSESTLRAQFLERAPIFKAWGDFVTCQVRAGITAALRRRGDRRSLGEFLKMPSEPRVKGVESFMAKALHRNKGYSNPIDQITDPVGVRFVVLLSSETDIVGRVIIDSPDWKTSQDRDYERERLAKPHWFDYESNHYIVRNLSDRTVGDVTVPAGIPCEIQVRTLLQHAYAELSHDRLYKPECQVPDIVHRLVARGSALLETTDHVFCQVSEGIERALAALRRPHDIALGLCVRHGICDERVTTDISFRLLEQFPDQLESMTEATFDDLLRNRSYVPRLMKQNASESVLFAHPAGLIAYWLVSRLQEAVVPRWPFDQQLLATIAADLGVGLSN